MNTLQRIVMGLSAGSLLAFVITTACADTLVVRSAEPTVPATTLVNGNVDGVIQPVSYRRWGYARPYRYGGWGPRYGAAYRGYYGPSYGDYYYGPPRAYRYYGAPYGYYDYPYGSARVGGLQIYWR